MMRIALDAMGGDFAPLAVVEGAINACEIIDDSLVLVGDGKFLTRFLLSRSWSGPIKVVDCPDYIKMSEPGARAIRKRRDLTITRAMKLLSGGKVHAVVTAGNSAGAVASAVHYLGCFPGIDRPVLACVLPTQLDPLVVLDVGANLEAQPYHLAQAGLLGEIYAEEAFGVKSPRIGLLNVGTEKNKGPRFIRKTYKLLRKVVRNFVGNIEGCDLFNGKVNVAVCDGFVGNLVLKSCESWGESVWRMWQARLDHVLAGSRDASIVRGALEEAYNTIDYRQAGGAPLLGVNGVVVIAHGRSSAKAISNAIRFADELVKRDVIGKMERRFEDQEMLERSESVLPGAVFRKIRRKLGNKG